MPPDDKGELDWVDLGQISFLVACFMLVACSNHCFCARINLLTKYLNYWILIFLSCSGVFLGMGNPSGNITRAGTGMGEFFYPRAYTGNSMGKISPSACGYRVVIPIEHVIVAILTHVQNAMQSLYRAPNWGHKKNRVASHQKGQKETTTSITVRSSASCFPECQWRPQPTVQTSSNKCW
jgi:hypothetical protein